MHAAGPLGMGIPRTHVLRGQTSSFDVLRGRRAFVAAGTVDTCFRAPRLGAYFLSEFVRVCFFL